MILVALATLVSCDNVKDVFDETFGDAEEAEPKILDECGCLSELTNMVEDMESIEDLGNLEEMWLETYPECASFDDYEAEQNCPEEMEELLSVMLSKAMERGEM